MYYQAYFLNKKYDIICDLIVTADCEEEAIEEAKTIYEKKGWRFSYTHIGVNPLRDLENVG